jgi:TonB family protein
VESLVRHKPILFFLAILVCTDCFAQSDTVYLTLDHEFCDKSKALYSRAYTKIADGKYKVETFYTIGNGKVSSGFCLTKDSTSLDGPFVSYYDNGQKRWEGVYSNNDEIGEWKHYYEESGNIWYTCHYNNGVLDGELKSFYKSGELKRVEEHKNNNKSVKGKCFDKTGKEIDFTPFQIMPKPDYDLNRYLSKNLKYPKASLENNIEGRAIIRFVVNKQGKITGAIAVKNVSPELDAEALRIVSQMPDWEPGMEDDEPIPVFFNLPIVFKLK